MAQLIKKLGNEFQSINVTGPKGIGKSELVNHLINYFILRKEFEEVSFQENDPPSNRKVLRITTWEVPLGLLEKNIIVSRKPVSNVPYYELSGLTPESSLKLFL